ncbi:MAG: toll/interleukin-1 receptor domain-containing protein, partial [Pseudomonadota bacterium]
MLAEALARRGPDVWWDVDLLPGDRFTDEIMAVLERAKLALVLWSERSVGSHWVRAEARAALEHGIL